jgi:hypothetical protein
VVGLAAWLSAGRLPGLTGAILLAAVAGIAAGLVVRRGGLLTAGLALLGVGYAVSLLGRDLDAAAPVYAGGLLLTAELAFWALEPGARVRFGRAATLRRAVFSGGLALAAAALGAVLLGVSSTRVGGGAVLEVLGVAAVGAVVATAVWLIHSLRSTVR